MSLMKIMKPLKCAAARSRLQAFHDGELPIAAQIAVSAHLDECEACAAAASELDDLGALLRAASPGSRPLSRDEVSGLHASIINRVKAEDDASWVAHVREMFEDMHLVYAGVGATAATVAVLVIMLTVMQFAARKQPVNFLAKPGSNEKPLAIDAHIMMPRALNTASFSAADSSGRVDEHVGLDSVFMLAAVVTREGRVADLQLLGDDADKVARGDGTRQVEDLLDAVSRTRFDPARREGLPVAVNMIWVVAHTTVRAEKPQKLGDRPAGKKRVLFRPSVESRPTFA
jgi:Putative zinc-finger